MRKKTWDKSKGEFNILSQFHPDMSIITSLPPLPLGPHQISICWAILIILIPAVEPFVSKQWSGAGKEFFAKFPKLAPQPFLCKQVCSSQSEKFSCHEMFVKPEF